MTAQLQKRAPQTKCRRVKNTAWLAGLVMAVLSLLSNIFSLKLSHFMLSPTDSIGLLSTSWDQKDLSDISSPSVVENFVEKPDGNDTVIFPRVCDDGPLLEPIWEWHYFSNNTNKNKQQAQKRLLVATYSAFGQYARLLELTSPINKAYAEAWNHDIVILQGTTMILQWDANCTPPEERSRFNKIDILLTALNRKDQYDQLLLLDADTLIYDFSYDITRLLSNETMLVAQRTLQDDPVATKSINNGVTLWNLHHPMTFSVARDWSKACRDGIPDNRPYRGDQYYLRQVLNDERRISSISSVWEEFYYRDGTRIKHFQRSNDRSWVDTGLDTREDRIMDTVREVCSKFQIKESDLDRKNYTVVIGNVSALVNCTPRRKSVWDLIMYSGNITTPASKRLLIAQYSSFGTYASLLEATAPLNKAYARKWRHDYLAVQGAALSLETDLNNCELPQYRSMHNKIPLLIWALSKNTEYDQILILDADTLMYNFSYDVTTLLGDDDMLAAQKVNANDTTHTWNINNGITLWNLKHNTTAKIAKQWLKRTANGLNGAHLFGWKDHSDQSYLHWVLQHQANAILYTKALDHEFRYDKGTVARHYVRPKNNDWTGYGKDRREQLIQKTAESICANFPADCEDLEHIPYSTL